MAETNTSFQDQEDRDPIDDAEESEDPWTLRERRLALSDGSVVAEKVGRQAADEEAEIARAEADIQAAKLAIIALTNRYKRFPAPTLSDLN